MNRRRFLLVAPPVVLGGLAWWWFALRRDSGAAPANVEQPPQKSGGLSDGEIRKQFDALEKNKQDYAAAMSSKEIESQNLAKAAAQTVKYREQLQFDKATPWSQYIAAHRQEYQSLRRKVAASPDGKTACTICNGIGEMNFCILCESTGACPTCKGTGKLPDGDFCPTCQGKGKCYLCKGSKRMLCAFCDDGVIAISTPPPPAQMPI